MGKAKIKGWTVRSPVGLGRADLIWLPWRMEGKDGVVMDTGRVVIIYIYLVI